MKPKSRYYGWESHGAFMGSELLRYVFPFFNDAMEVSDRLRKIEQFPRWLRRANLVGMINVPGHS